MRYLYVLREIFATLFCSLSIGCSIWFMVMLAQEYNDRTTEKRAVHSYKRRTRSKFARL
jgi:hypothetical protein